MSSAYNHMKRSHRSEGLHRQASADRNIINITRQNVKVTPFAHLIQSLKAYKARREKKTDV